MIKEGIQLGRLCSKRCVFLYFSSVFSSGLFSFAEDFCKFVNETQKSKFGSNVYNKAALTSSMQYCVCVCVCVPVLFDSTNNWLNVTLPNTRVRAQKIVLFPWNGSKDDISVIKRVAFMILAVFWARMGFCVYIVSIKRSGRNQELSVFFCFFPQFYFFLIEYAPTI